MLPDIVGSYLLSYVLGNVNDNHSIVIKTFFFSLVLAVA